MYAIQRPRCVAPSTAQRLAERRLGVVEAPAGEREVGRPPERAREPPAVAGPPEELARLGELPLRAARGRRRSCRPARARRAPARAPRRSFSARRSSSARSRHARACGDRAVPRARGRRGGRALRPDRARRPARSNALAGFVEQRARAVEVAAHAGDRGAGSRARSRSPRRTRPRGTAAASPRTRCAAPGRPAAPLARISATLSGEGMRSGRACERAERARRLCSSSSSAPVEVAADPAGDAERVDADRLRRRKPSRRASSRPRSSQCCAASPASSAATANSPRSCTARHCGVGVAELRGDQRGSPRRARRRARACRAR